MFKKIMFVCRLIVILALLILAGYFIYSYVIKPFRKAQEYSYNVVESNMQSAMISYLLNDYQYLGSKSSIKLELSELIKDDYISEGSIPNMCSIKKSYIVEYMNNGEIKYKICLICGSYKSKDC